MDHFTSKLLVDEETGCWVFQGGKDKDGYGHYYINRGYVRAHRYSYELYKGPIPKGLLVCHICDNPPCANPAHLWVGTQKDNKRDCLEKGRGRGCCLPEEAHPKAKLTKEDVIEIRYYLALGATQQAVADAYGVNQTLVSLIKNRTIWRNV